MPDTETKNTRAGPGMPCRLVSRRLPRHVAVAIALAALLTTACAGNKPKSVELPVPAQRLNFDSYSFVPPEEKEWFVAERGPDFIVLAKAGKYIGQTLTIQSARVTMPPTPATLLLVNHVRSSELKALPPPRFRIRAHEVVPTTIDGATCVMSQVEAEDREPTATTGPIVALLMESFSLTCRDTARAGSGVQLSYTHRSFPEDRDSGLRPRAEAVLSSLRLLAPDQR